MKHFSREVMDRATSPEALHGRMSFLCGPRQIGKTTAVARFLAQNGLSRLYYNWDTPSVKRRFAADAAFFVQDLPPEVARPWVGLDEIHKYPKWKNLLKGYYDEWRENIQFIVTGSARLDHFRKSGDSLVGRYFLFRMLPLGVREVMPPASRAAGGWTPGEKLDTIPLADRHTADALQNLLDVAGFPEPFATGTQDFCTRWRENYISLLLQEDLRDLTKIVQLRKLETMLYLLPAKVGSPLSLNSLCQPLEAAHGSVRAWLEAMKMVYLVFTVGPWTARLSRSVRKEEKCYFWDWGMVDSPGARFENFVAVQLQRAVAMWNEKGKGPFTLHYLRTKSGQEVDFAVADRKKVYLLVEAKASEDALDPNLPMFQGKVNADLAMQVVNKKGLCAQKGKGLYVMGADRFFSLLS